MTQPSWMAGIEVGKDQGFDPVWRVADRQWWPATMIYVGDPYALKPDQFSPKGSLRVRFGFVIDGTAKYLRDTLGVDSISDEILANWYTLSKTVRFPVRDDAPAPWNIAADKAADWVFDLGEIARWRKPLAPIAEMNGSQSMFGVIQQLGGVRANVDKSKPPIIDWGKVFGARAWVLNAAAANAGYVDSVRHNHDLNVPDELRGTLPPVEDQEYLLGKMAAFSARFDAGAALPGEQPPVLFARHWPVKKQENGAALAAKVPVPPYLKVWIGALLQEFGPRAQGLVFPIITTVAEQHGLTARRFSDLDVQDAWTAALVRIVETAMANGIQLPSLSVDFLASIAKDAKGNAITLPPVSALDENWMDRVEQLITLHSDNVDASAFV